MKIIYDIKSVSTTKGNQNKKVFIYEDGELEGVLWMSWEDIRANKEDSLKRGDEVEIKESYKDEK